MKVELIWLIFGCCGLLCPPQLASHFFQVHANDPPITAVIAVPNSSHRLVGSASGVWVENKSGQKISTLDSELKQVLGFSFSADATQVAICGGQPGVVGIVEFWSWPDQQRLWQIDGHHDVIHQTCWLRDDTILLTASADHSLQVWDLINRTRQHRLTGHSGPILALAAAPDESLICSAGVDQTIRVWDPDSWQSTRILNNHLGTVHAMQFSPTEHNNQWTLASASEDETVRIWYPNIGRLVRIARHPKPVLSLTWDRAGQRLFSGDTDGQLREMTASYFRIVQARPVSDQWLNCLDFDTARNHVLIGAADGVVRSQPVGR